MLEGQALRTEVERLSDFTPTASEAQHFLLATLVEEFSNLVLQPLGTREIAHLRHLHGAMGECLATYEATFTLQGEDVRAQQLEDVMPSPTSTFGLVVEDEGLIAFDLKSMLIQYGITVGVAPSLARAWTFVNKQKPDVAILDIRVLDGETYDLARYLLDHGTSVIFVTAYPTLPKDLLTTPCLTKPLDPSELKACLDKALCSRAAVLEI